MAIYHLSMQMISRSKGQSAVASASYRSGEKLVDERTGETKFYQREVQPETMILAPSSAPAWIKDRNRLWNEVEKSETRKNSQLAREINVALPKELSNEKQTELIQGFAQKQFVDKGMVADIAIHRDDKNNPHAHIMLTTRAIDKDGFGKKERDWNADFAKSKGKAFVKSADNCLDVREQWSEHANKALEKEGVQERISHLSHEARGIEQLPTVHLGHVAHSMEKEGKESKRGDLNREIQQHNRDVIDLAEYRKEKEAIQHRISQERRKQGNPALRPQEPQKAPIKKEPVSQPQVKKASEFLTAAEKVAIQKAVPIVKGYVTLDKIQERRPQLDQWEKKLQNSKTSLDWKSEAFEKARGHFNRQHSLAQKIEGHQEQINNINWLNPLKIKENRLTKERAEKGIEAYQKDFDYQEKKLDYFREKLKFTDKDDFFAKEKSFKTEKEEKTNSNFKQKQEIKEQRQTLDTAEKALKQGGIRQVASQYPELKTAGEYLSYANAMKLKELNEKVGRVVPIDTVKNTLNARQEEIDKRNNAIATYDKGLKNVNLADSYFKKLAEVEQKIEQTEKSPMAKAKMMFSKEAKAEHEKDLQQRDQYKKAIENTGFKDPEQVAESKEKFASQQGQREKTEERIQDFESGNYQGGHNVGSGLLEAVLQGVQQAQEKEQSQAREQEKKRQKQRVRGQKTIGLDR